HWKRNCSEERHPSRRSKADIGHAIQGKASRLDQSTPLQSACVCSADLIDDATHSDLKRVTVGDQGPHQLVVGEKRPHESLLCAPAMKTTAVLHLVDLRCEMVPTLEPAQYFFDAPGWRKMAVPHGPRLADLLINRRVSGRLSLRITQLNSQSPRQRSEATRWKSRERE